MPKNKIKVGVIFGGRSAEHEVSLVSATSVIKNLDKSKYDVVPIGITKEGKWLSSGETLKLLKEGNKGNREVEKIIIPDPNQKSLVKVDEHFATHQEKTKIDVIFPVLHGPYGEDGTIQGLFELANIPYVGAGVLGSSIGMDKVIQKQILRQKGLPVVDWVCFLKKDWLMNKQGMIKEIKNKVSFPLFVKPANMGSSVGITKVHHQKELAPAINLALKYDRKVLVEKAVEPNRDIEVSVLGNDNPKASMPGEIVSSNEFYDYDAKYVDGQSKAVIPAPLSKQLTQKIRQLAVEAFKALDCAGMARVDFLLKENKAWINELNTIPGFTSISMYPKLWEASGLPYPKLLDKLIQLAIERHQEKNQLKTSYKPKKNWYR